MIVLRGGGEAEGERERDTASIKYIQIKEEDKQRKKTTTGKETRKPIPNKTQHVEAELR